MCVATDLLTSDPEVLEHILGYRFRDRRVRRRMLTTYSAQTEESESLAKLAQRGDALIYDFIWDILARRYPEAGTRLLGEMRAALVSNKVLNRLGARLMLLPFLDVGRCSTLPFKAVADVMEATIGAIFQDAGGFSGKGVSTVMRLLAEWYLVDIEIARFSNPDQLLREMVKGIGGVIKYHYSKFHQNAHVQGCCITRADVEIRRLNPAPRISTFGIAMAQNQPTEKARRAAASLALLELFPENFESNLNFHPEIWEFPRVVQMFGHAVSLNGAYEASCAEES